MRSISEKLIALKIATRYACNIDATSGSIVNLRVKLLYLLSVKPHTPQELIGKLCMAKSNLALLCGKAVKDGLIIKLKPVEDKRAVCYNITQKGRTLLNTTLGRIEDEFRRILTTEQEYNDSIKKIDEVLHLLSFL